MSATPKLDRRVGRTRQQLSTALVQLSLERGFEHVTVRDLTERASVGYATFFRHYPDTEALLHDLLEAALTELIGAVSALSEQPEQMLAVLFERLEEHADRYRLLLRTQHITRLLERVLALGSQIFLARETPRPDARVPPELAAHHAIASSVTLIEWWLEHGMPYRPERMGEIVALLVLRPVVEIAFEPHAPTHHA